jgi:hypothetical protein
LPAASLKPRLPFAVSIRSESSRKLFDEAGAGPRETREGVFDTSCARVAVADDDRTAHAEKERAAVVFGVHPVAYGDEPRASTTRRVLTRVRGTARYHAKDLPGDPLGGLEDDVAGKGRSVTSTSATQARSRSFDVADEAMVSERGERVGLFGEVVALAGSSPTLIRPTLGSFVSVVSRANTLQG